jgi:Tol biopolymer transport system component
MPMGNYNNKWDNLIYLTDIEETQTTQITKFFDDTIRFYRPILSPCVTKILYNHIENNINRLFIMDIDGTNVKELPTMHQAQFSSDGKKLVGRGEGGYLYIMNLDGTDYKKLSTNPSSSPFSWSKDNSKIAYSASLNLGWQIFIIDLVQNTEYQLSDNQYNSYNPIFIPDEDKIVYFRNFGGSWETSEICTNNLLGTDEKRLTFNNDSESDFRLSPDGKNLYFTRKMKSGYYFSNPNIFVINLETGIEKQLTFDGNSKLIDLSEDEKIIIIEKENGYLLEYWRMHINDLNTIKYINKISSRNDSVFFKVVKGKIVFIGSKTIGIEESVDDYN